MKNLPTILFFKSSTKLGIYFLFLWCFIMLYYNCYFKQLIQENFLFFFNNYKQVISYI